MQIACIKMVCMLPLAFSTQPDGLQAPFKVVYPAYNARPYVSGSPVRIMWQGKTAGKDLLSDKVTYPSLLGLEKSKAIAAELIAEAKKALEGYSLKDSAPLLALAEYIGSRTN